MTKYIIIIFSFICSISARAHQPDLSSTMLVQQENNQWVLQIRAALTAFEYEVEASFGKEAYDTPEAFQALVLAHVKKNLAISFDGSEQVNIDNGFINLGHETNVVLEVIGVPETFKALTIKNTSFKDIHRNQSALVILKKGVAQDQFVLDKSNGHTADLLISQDKFILVSKASIGGKMMLMFVVIFAFILTFAFLAFRQNWFQQETLAIEAVKRN